MTLSPSGLTKRRRSHLCTISAGLSSGQLCFMSVDDLLFGIRISHAVLFPQTYSTYIPSLVGLVQPLGPRVTFWTKWALWANYWWWQSLVGCGFWTLAHEVMASAV